MVTLEINANEFVLHPTGAVYWREKQTWLLADIHLGKVAHFRKNGIAVPRAAEGSFYQKIALLLSLFPVKRLLFLGIYSTVPKITNGIYLKHGPKNNLIKWF